jgi:hypothetical protein
MLHFFKNVEVKWLDKKYCTSKGKSAFDFGINRSNNKAFRLLHTKGESKTIIRNDRKYLPIFSA